MTAAEWLSAFIATGICLAIGYWLHRVNKLPDETRTESLAIGFGWIGVAVVLGTQVAQ